MPHTRNNTDSNELVIFSGTVLYHDDTYIISSNGGVKHLRRGGEGMPPIVVD